MHTDLGDDVAYYEGKLAYKAGHRSDANPYKRNSRKYLGWRYGWTDGALWDAATCDASEQNEDGGK